MKKSTTEAPEEWPWMESVDWQSRTGTEKERIHPKDREE